MIAPIGDDESAARLRSDRVLKFLITPVVAKLGYAQPLRADHLPTPGIITSQVIQHLVDDDLVVADLTGANPNVYYELAIRHMIRKPLVQVVERGEPIPFDVAGARTIQFDHTDLNSVEAAKSRLKAQIIAAEADPTSVDNPISIALDLKALREGSDPLGRTVGTLTSELAQVREDIRAIRHDQNVFDRMKTWQLVLARMNKFEELLDEKDGGTSTTIYDIDDVMSEMESLSSKIDDLAKQVSNE